MKTEKFRMNKFDSLTIQQLQQLGMSKWEKTSKGTLMLFPGKWYDKIPDGFLVTDIFGKTEKFKHGKTDKDTRFGCLPYGVLVKNK